jgi:tRNA(Arg) A34 adenosine deaminase TadA
MSIELGAAENELLRRSFRVADEAREAGNQPFGAVLADAGGRVLLEAGNSVVSDRDPTAHAERNLVTLAHQQGLSANELAQATLYASTEPCPMCAGAIYWGGIGRVVFGVDQGSLYALIQQEVGVSSALILPCSELLSRGSRRVEVIGPALIDEALSVHRRFWGGA